MTFSPEQMMHFNVSLHTALSPSEAVLAKHQQTFTFQNSTEVLSGFSFFFFSYRLAQITHISHGKWCTAFRF